MARDHSEDLDRDGVATEPQSTVEVRRSAVRRTVEFTDAAKPTRLAPRPDKGLPFAEALDETMRDHRAVFAALAK